MLVYSLVVSCNLIEWFFLSTISLLIYVFIPSVTCWYVSHSKTFVFFADINWISCWERFFVLFFLFFVFCFHSIQRFIILINFKWITFQRFISEQDKALAPQLHCFAQEFREDVSLHSLLNLKRHPLYFF